LYEDVARVSGLAHDIDAGHVKVGALRTASGAASAAKEVQGFHGRFPAVAGRGEVLHREFRGGVRLGDQDTNQVRTGDQPRDCEEARSRSAGNLISRARER